MTGESYKRACDIRAELYRLKWHKSSLEKENFSEARGCLQFNRIALIDDVVPPDFNAVYLGLLDAKIKSLENEFEQL